MHLLETAAEEWAAQYSAGLHAKDMERADYIGESRHGGNAVYRNLYSKSSFGSPTDSTLTSEHRFADVWRVVVRNMATAQR